MKNTVTHYKNEFNRKAYDRLNIVVPKGQKEIIQEYATSQGKSLNSFVIESIEEKMKQSKSES